MSKRKLFLFFVVIAALIAAIGMPTTSSDSNDNTTQTYGLIVGRNVNMVSGTQAPHGDPYLQRQNEPSVAVSTRNPMHLLAGANDYRTIDIPFQDFLPGKEEYLAQIRDAWVGVFKSFNGGQSWISTLLPGYPQDTSPEGTSSPLHGYDFACDPTVRAGANGLFYYSGIAAERGDRARGVVFVARYIDSNNSEFLDTIEYVDTRIPDTGNPGLFLDMPHIAVDVPRGSGTVTIKEQEIPQSNVYITYTRFMGKAGITVRDQVLFSRSTDCGETWSRPIILSESRLILQRPTIAIDPHDPTGNTIYVAFRQFQHPAHTVAITIVKSTDGGQTFTMPVHVTTCTPFDQVSSNVSFRTSSYPSLAVDGNGIVYLAWTQRMEPEGLARIVIATSSNGLDWPPNQIKDVENSHATEDVKGHQFMPSLTYAGGKLMLAWYDQRHDIAQDILGDGAFTPYIEDYGCRHTIDVRVAYGTPGIDPIFSPSRQVSRYLYTLDLDEYGEPIEEGENWKIDQAEFNPINFPLFQLGTTPFHGDWMEAAPSPWIFLSPNGQWSFNTYSSQPTTSLMIWTDNRDVNPPGGSWWGEWTDYPEWPYYNAPDSEETPPRDPCSNELNTGMRNQNIYTANISDGLIVGSPQNTKQLDHPFIQRTFVVYAKNTTEEERYFEFRIDELGYATASFEQEPPNVHELKVAIAPFSSASVTVYVDPYSGETSTAIRIDVIEIYGSGSPKPGGLYGYVLLNPDSTNPDVIDHSDPNNPEDLGNEYHNPRVQGPRVWGYDLGNASEINPRVQGPRVQGFAHINTGFINPRVQGPRVQGEDPLNPRVQGPRVWGPRVQGPRVQGINVLNQDIVNPRVQGPRVQGTALTDVTYPIVNDGNTTSAYSINIRSLVAEDFDEGKLIAQVLIYKVHTSPVADGCDLKQVHHDELVANIYNPRVQGSTQTSRATTQSDGDWQTPEPTIHLEPNQTGYVTVRVWDDDTTDSFVFSPDNVTIDMPAQAIDTIGETGPEVGYPPGHGPDQWPDPSPKIWRSPESLSFTAQEEGTDPDSQTFQVMNITDGTTLNYEVTKDVPWLTVSPSVGPLDCNESYTHKVSVNISDLSAGTYTANIVIFDTDPDYPASNNPQFVRVKLYVISSTTEASQVKLSGPTWVQAGEISKAFTLISLDDNGNPANVTGNTVFNLASTSSGAIFYSDPGGYNDIAKVTIAHESSSAKFYYKDTEAGDHTITATDSNPPGLGPATHPISVIIGAAEYLKVTGNSAVNAGDIKELAITAYDQYDNVAIGYSGPKFLTFSGPGDAPDETKPTVEGAYIGTPVIVNFTEGVSDTEAATLIAYNAEITLINVSDGLIDSLADPNYGFELTVDPADFDPNESSVSNVYPSPAVAGETVTIEITTYDEFQNLRTVGGDTVNISITNCHDMAIPSVAITFDNGIYWSTYGPTLSCIDDIVGVINGSPTARDDDGTSDGTYHLTINPGDANYFKVTGNSTVTAGGSKELTITAYDQYHNVATGYTGPMSLIFEGPSPAPDGTPPTVAGIEIGNTTTINFINGVSDPAILTVYRAEDISVDVRDATDEFLNSFADETYDFDLTVTPAAASGAESSISSVSPDPATAGSSVTITVTAYDQYQNALISREDTVVINVTGSNTATPAVSDIGNGTYTASYTPIVSGPDEITGTINGADIGRDAEGTSDGTYHLTVNPGAASQAVLTGPSSVEASSVSNPFTLESQDGLGNTSNVIGDTVFNLYSDSGGTGTFYSDAEGTIVISTLIIADSSNSASFYYKDTLAVTPTVTASYSTGPVDLYTDSHQLQVYAGPPFKLAFNQQPTDTHANEPISPAVTVEVQDEFGNLVTSADDSVTITLNDIPGGGATLSGGDPIPAINGVATFDSPSVSGCGEGYILSASSAGLNPATSTAFNIFAEITGTVQWNGASVVNDILPGTHDANIWGRKYYGEGSDEPIPAENITYDDQTGVYAVTNILPADYKFYVVVDTQESNFKWYPGNYHGEGSIFQVIDGEAVVNYYHNTQKIMLMTAPAGALNASNINEDPYYHSVPYPYIWEFLDHTYSPEITFEWGPITEATSYTYSVQEFDTTDPYYQVSVVNGSVISSSVALPPLSPSGVDKYYGIRITAHNSSNWIGKVIISWNGGLSELYNFRVVPELVITTTSVPDAINGESYSATLQAEGGIPPYVWDVLGLPTGFTFTETGEIDGTPNYPAGPYVFQVVVEDSGGAETKQTTYKDLVMTIIDHTVSTPNIPNGPTWGITDILYTFNTGGATCSIGGHNVEYRFDWGDGSYSSWSSSASSSHSYTNVGTYSVKAQARCSEANSIESSWSSGFTVDIWPTISGTVTDGGGNPIAGVQVISINGAWGDDTDANGNYRVEVPYNQDVTGLEALKIGYTFSPIYQMIEMAVADNIVGKDFTGTIITFTLTVLKDGTGSGEVNSSLPGISCGVDCTEVYDYNTVVTLTALPESGSEFAGWSGECSGTGTCQVTMTKNTTVTATFNILHTISAPGAPTGTTSGIPNTSYYYYLSSYSICSHGHIVEHQFDWGDSNQSGWIPGSNKTHSWASPGIYQVKVRGKCTEGLISNWSPPLSVTINPRISGYVTYQPPIGPSQPVQGLTIYFSGGVGPALTNAGGYYKKTVSYNWSGTVVPSDLYNYSTTYRTYTNVTADTTSQDYVATTQNIRFITQPTNASAGQLISVKVYVHDGSNNPLPGVMVTLNIGANPGGITFTQLTGVTLVTGYKTFTFSIGTSGVGYTVIATSGKSVSSVPFDIY